MALFLKGQNKLVYRYDAEKLWIESWGENSLRIRSTKLAEMPGNDWALLPPVPSPAVIDIREDRASIRNGRIEAKISKIGVTIQS
jgi:alpha-D-xyloside xylohydrolase